MNAWALRREETLMAWKSRGNSNSQIGWASRRTWTPTSACPRNLTAERCISWSDRKFPFLHAFPHSFTFWRASGIFPITELRTLPSRGQSGAESTGTLRRSFPGELFKGMTSSRTTSARYSTMRECQRESCSVSRVRAPRAVAKALWRARGLEPSGEGSGARGYIAVRMAALKEMAQAVARLLEGVVEFIDFLGRAGHFSRVHIRDEFMAQVRGASNAPRDEHRNDFAVIPALELKFPQLLNRQGGRAKRVDSVAEFVQQAEVDAFGLERFFKFLQFDAGL